MPESKLLIKPAVKSLSWLRKIGYKKPLGNSLIRYGIKIKNIDTKPFSGATIKNISISSAEGKTAHLTSEKEFKVETLNPDEEILIWFEDTFIPFSGLVFINLELDGKDKILACQWDRGNKSPSKGDANKWSDIVIISDENILQQKTTNALLVILTILTILFKI